VFNEDKRTDINNNHAQEEEDDDGWGDSWGPTTRKVDLTKENMRSKNLNHLNEEELAAHKLAMDEDFNKN